MNGGKINIGTQSNYPVGSNPLVPFQFLVYDASGIGGVPGVQIAGPFDFTPTAYGWNNFTIFGSAGGSGGPWSLLKYVPGPNVLNTSDLAMSPGEYWYRVTAYYDFSSYGFPGSFDESFYAGPEPVYILFVPDNRTIQNKTITNGMTECFDAVQVITVAGNNTSYTVLNGGSVTMIAGQKIDFLPTTPVHSGGYLHGSITSNGTYCGSKSPSLVSIPETDPKNPDNGRSSFFKVYPNPTRGNFMVEFDDSRVFNDARVEIYNVMGEKVLVKTITVKRNMDFRLPACRPESILSG